MLNWLRNKSNKKTSQTNVINNTTTRLHSTNPTNDSNGAYTINRQPNNNSIPDRIRSTESITPQATPTSLTRSTSTVSNQPLMQPVKQPRPISNVLPVSATQTSPQPINIQQSTNNAVDNDATAIAIESTGSTPIDSSLAPMPSTLSYTTPISHSVSVTNPLDNVANMDAHDDSDFRMSE